MKQLHGATGRKPMQMNRMEHDLWLASERELCPECADGCAGRESCVKLAERIVERKAEIAAGK